MENFPTTGTTTTATQKPMRPTFLTVLCILTFIGSGLSVISNINSYLTADVSDAFVQEKLDSTRKEVGEQLKEADSKAGAEFADKMLSGVSEVMNPKNIKRSALYGLLASALTLFGAVMMFRLNKTGFWVYVAGTIVGIAAPIMIFGTSNLFSLGIVALTGFFGIIFVILYSMNLKYME
ncbi:hypothetical protein [Pollutibacter soli]|uniref:hypothetical protein n=1 Tax=Pollutibacter soli TaxID=3034157 RepID=UPI0030132103